VESVSLEFVLMLGYAILLGVVALLLEFVARHAHRRSLSISTTGFTYHADKDMWRCPEFQHLFPVFVDHAKATVIYRASASACNACKCKAHCTDSNNGREIERKMTDDFKFGMQRFHRAMSVTLLVLASLILAIELFRDEAVYPRIVLASVLTVFCTVVLRLLKALFTGTVGM
jgi:hypothetical protein